MQEVEGFLGGETDYYNLKGDTGPLVYPAGFVYLYSLFYYVTDQGRDIYLAQWIFLGLYVTFVFVVHRVYLRVFRAVGNPSFINCAVMLVLLSLSRRIHSLFVLRLFNDCFAMFFLYIAIYLFIANRWGLGCFFYSIGVSIKMNVLLFAPALLTLLLFRFTFDKVVRHLIICAMVQWILALPFMTTFPISYLHRSFELGRQFMYKWTTNWKMVPEETFLSKPFALGLLFVHISILLFLAFFKWIPALKSDLQNWKGLRGGNISGDLIAKVLFSANFVGVACARSLHYQFYVWYFHSVPLLLFSCRKSLGTFFVLPIVLILALEVCWNVYPATPFTSSLMLSIHVLTSICILADGAFWTVSVSKVKPQ
jgi:alpha-1,3-mannosyltransferase